ncbi:hypothetical protein bcgnr5390_15410 [Bacillus luti]
MTHNFHELISNATDISIPSEVDAATRSIKRHRIIYKFIRPFYYLSLICLLPSMSLFSNPKWWYVFLLIVCISGILTKTYSYVSRRRFISKVMYPLTKIFPISTNMVNKKMDIDMWNKAIELVKYRGNEASRDKWITFPTNFGTQNFSKIKIMYNLRRSSYKRALTTSTIYENCFAYSKIKEDLQPFEIRPSTSKDGYNIPYELKGTDLAVFINDFSNYFGEYVHVVVDKHNISIFLDDLLGKSTLFSKDSDLSHPNISDSLIVMYSFYTIANLAYDYSLKAR